MHTYDLEVFYVGEKSNLLAVDYYMDGTLRCRKHYKELLDLIDDMYNWKTSGQVLLSNTEDIVYGDVETEYLEEGSAEEEQE